MKTLQYEAKIDIGNGPQLCSIILDIDTNKIVKVTPLSQPNIWSVDGLPIYVDMSSARTIKCKV